ncbi:MAG: hypothetical protein KDC60_03080 [Bacteroidetes bacterium]|nr:hypothetical protein [Bacteroidota bacterium]
MRSILAILLLSIGTFSASFLLLKNDLFSKDIESMVVEKVWQKDMDLLIEKNQLPPSWKMIREIRVTALSPKAARWLRNSKIPVHLNPKGIYQLELTVDHNEEPDSIAVITTYNLVDLKSKNTLWEFGRTYSIPNKKWLNRAEKWIAIAKSFFPENREYSSVAPETEDEKIESTDKPSETPVVEK